jgi:hypothetical protein
MIKFSRGLKNVHPINKLKIVSAIELCFKNKPNLNSTYIFIILFKRNTNPAGLFQQVSLIPHKGYRRYALKHKSNKATVKNICFKGTVSLNLIRAPFKTKQN